MTIAVDPRVAGLSRQLPQYTWAQANAAGMVAALSGQEIRITDVGPNGSNWYSTGTVLQPCCGGSVILYQLAAPADMTAGTVPAPNTTEQLLTPAIAIPAGLLRAGSQFRVTMGCDKSNTADTCTFQIKMGSTGTAADTSLISAGLATTNISQGLQGEWQRTSSTQVRKHGAGVNLTNSLTTANTSARAAAKTIANMDTTANYIIVTGVMTTGTGEIGTLHAFTLELLP